jgi:hypothetical protein
MRQIISSLRTEGRANPTPHSRGERRDMRGEKRSWCAGCGRSAGYAYRGMRNYWKTDKHPENAISKIPRSAWMRLETAMVFFARGQGSMSLDAAKHAQRDKVCDFALYHCNSRDTIHRGSVSGHSELYHAVDEDGLVPTFE